MFFILFFVCIVFQLIPLHFLTLNVSLKGDRACGTAVPTDPSKVTTHVVSANPTKFTKVGQYNPYVVWMATQDEYWPILPNSPSVDGHTRLVPADPTKFTKVGQYHTCVVWMATQDWYGRSYQIHQGQPVPYLHSVDGHTRLVPADPTKFTKVGQYHTCVVWMATQDWYGPILPNPPSRPVPELHERGVGEGSVREGVTGTGVAKRPHGVVKGMTVSPHALLFRLPGWRHGNQFDQPSIHPFFFDLYGCELGDFFLGLVPEVTVPVLVAVQVRAEAEL
ncbi:hypothetical protein BGY98DRAFT_939079 [Russula aff. rugulosa BPL654]|nr:hypothetical protein BGY98DRAFT_939079 [Russula aff. rugulosa BPL654]